MQIKQTCGFDIEMILLRSCKHISKRYIDVCAHILTVSYFTTATLHSFLLMS